MTENTLVYERVISTTVQSNSPAAYRYHHGASQTGICSSLRFNIWAARITLNMFDIYLLVCLS